MIVMVILGLRMLPMQWRFFDIYFYMYVIIIMGENYLVTVLMTSWHVQSKVDYFNNQFNL